MEFILLIVHQTVEIVFSQSRQQQTYNNKDDESLKRERNTQHAVNLDYSDI